MAYSPSSSEDELEQNLSNNLKSLNETFKELFETKKFADVIFVVHGKVEFFS